MHDDAVWPALPADAWADTRDTVHMWTQIVGKVRMATTPMVNHWWNVTLYVSPRGLTTSPMPHGDRTFQIDFDFEDHRLDIDTADGERRSMKLEPRSVADFYNELMAQLDELGLSTPIWTMPVEVEGAIPFDEDDEHASYDAQAANRFWRVLVQSDRVLHKFRAGFVGKVSPVHFFWGGFDLAVTRFSGRGAPAHTLQPPHCGPHVMREAYSHEVSSAGYWPAAGGAEGAFYSYAYPVPDGFADASVGPAPASFNEELGEFVLPYERVRAADDPDAMLLEFLQTTYATAADTARWDRPALEAARAQLPGFSAAERSRARR
jgi:hypothetical protein